MISGKYLAIAADIRNGILTGALRPGERLPTRNALKLRYGTTGATIQKAMEELQHGDFIEAFGKCGTFVAERPPNLYRYAVVFPGMTDQDTLWEQFVIHRRFLEERFECRFEFYYLEYANSTCREFLRLTDDALAGSLAGILFPYPPQENLLAPLLVAGTPCVAVTGEQPEKINTVWVDYGGFFRSAFDRLYQAGCRQIAVLTSTKMPIEYMDELIQHAARRQLAIPEWRRIGCAMDAHSMLWIGNVISLLLQPGVNGRPDGLILANENFREHVLHAIQSEGITPGKDIRIVQHSNFPGMGHNSFPVERLGFEIGAIVSACLQTLSRYRQTGIVDHSALVPVTDEQHLEFMTA